MKFQFQLQFHGGRIDETALGSIMIRVGEYDSQEMTKEEEKEEKEEKEDEEEAEGKDDMPKQPNMMLTLGSMRVLYLLGPDRIKANDS